jgi:hypothetical protein
VTRAVLEQELATKPRAPVTPPAAADSNGAPPIDRGRPARARNRRPEAKIEAQLLRLLLEAPEWLARARSEVPPERFQVPAYREIFERLRAEPADASSDVVYDRLAPEFQEVWQRLMRADVLTPDLSHAADAYAAAIEALEEGERLRAAPPPGDVVAHQAWLAGLKPETREKYQWRKAASRARGLATPLPVPKDDTDAR